MKHVITLAIVAAIGAVSSLSVAADDPLRDDTSYLQRVEPQYLSVAGSHDNLASLTAGLRTGAPITLLNSTDGSAITFTAPTKPMGYGNITHALDYATRDLAAAGIASPTTEQLHAALMGGSVTNAAGETTVLPGVLQLRSQGMGWGKIAHTIGIHPSPHAKAGVTSGGALSSKAPRAAAKPASGKATGITTAGGSGHAVGANGKPSKSGIVTAGGSRVGAGSARIGGTNHARSGIVTAAGAGGNTAFASGISNAQGGAALGGGAMAGGRVSAAGSSSGHGHAYGKSRN